MSLGHGMTRGQVSIRRSATPRALSRSRSLPSRSCATSSGASTARKSPASRPRSQRASARSGSAPSSSSSRRRSSGSARRTTPPSRPRPTRSRRPSARRACRRGSVAVDRPAIPSTAESSLPSSSAPPSWITSRIAARAAKIRLEAATEAGRSNESRHVNLLRNECVEREPPCGTRSTPHAQEGEKLAHNAGSY